MYGAKITACGECKHCHGPVNFTGEPPCGTCPRCGHFGWARLVPPPSGPRVTTEQAHEWLTLIQARSTTDRTLRSVSGQIVGDLVDARAEIERLRAIVGSREDTDGETIKRLRAELDAAEQHVRILQDQRMNSGPSTDMHGRDGRRINGIREAMTERDKFEEWARRETSFDLTRNSERGFYVNVETRLCFMTWNARASVGAEVTPPQATKCEHGYWDRNVCHQCVSLRHPSTPPPTEGRVVGYRVVIHGQFNAESCCVLTTHGEPLVAFETDAGSLAPLDGKAVSVTIQEGVP